MFWGYDDPDLSLCITFSEDMNTALKPDPDKFSVIVDGIPKEPDSLTWLNDRVLSFDYSEAILNPTVVNLDFPVLDPKLRTAASQQVGTFFAVGVELYEPLTGTYVDPTYNVFLDFNTDMDQTATPLIGDFTLTEAGNPIAIVGVGWAGPRQLQVQGVLGGGGKVNVVLNYPTPSPRMVCLKGNQACPFSFVATIP